MTERQTEDNNLMTHNEGLLQAVIKLLIRRRIFSSLKEVEFKPFTSRKSGNIRMLFKEIK